MTPDQLTLPTARATCDLCGGTEFYSHDEGLGPVCASCGHCCAHTPAQRAAFSRNTDPPTSHAAAASIGRGVEEAVLYVHRYSVLARESNGLTDSELVALLPDWYGPSLVSARSRLSKRGLLRDSGTTRPSARGRDSIVWVVA